MHSVVIFTKPFSVKVIGDTIKKLDAKGKCVLIIPDLHIPFEHRDALKFITAIADRYKPEVIINLGDELDFKAINFHQDNKADDIFTACKELEVSVKTIEKYYRLFPKVHLLESNHGSMVYRRAGAGANGIPLHVLKSYQEVLGTPNWSWHEDIILNTLLGEVYLCHGKSGKVGELSKQMGCNAVQGHFHSRFEITWHKSLLRERYNLFSGCLINRMSMAFAYSKTHLPRPILGLTVLLPSGYPQLMKMDLKSNDRWSGKIY